MLGTAEGLLQSSLGANIGAHLNDLVGGGPNASKPDRFNDAVGGAAFDVALPSPGLSKALLDQGGCLSPGLEQIVNWLSKRVARAEAVDLRGSRIPPSDAPVPVTQDEALLNQIENVDAHLEDCTLAAMG
jgi:hypothetical protein